MLTSIKSLELEEYPKSFMRIIKFYRLFGFSFGSFQDINNENRRKLFSKLINFWFIFYNLFIILVLIALNTISFSSISKRLIKSSPKPLMRGLFCIGMILGCCDIVSGYLFSLIRGKQFMKLFKSKDMSIIDCNTKMANKLIVANLVVFTMISIISNFVMINVTRNKWSSQTLIWIIHLGGVMASIFYMIVNFMFPFIYCYSSWVIIKQINNLNNNISNGNK
jgi:hypothetical protein